MQLGYEETAGQMMRRARDENQACADFDHAAGTCATCIGAGTRGVLGPTLYAEERAICDAAQAYADSLMCDASGKRIRNYITKEESAAPVYAACDNAMRGRVDQYETLNNPPERFVAYVGGDERGPIATVWTGLKLGRGYCLGRVSGRHAMTPVFAYRFRIAGREYHGRGQGEGMCIYLRETAESKRKRGA